MLDEILQRLGLQNYSQLTDEEQETVSKMMQAISSSAVTVESIKTFISAMREAIEKELVKTTNTKEEDIFLKARLKNYMLLDAMLHQPERMKDYLDKQVAAMVPKK